MITVNDLLPHFGGKKVNIARCLAVTKQLVSQWGDGPVPEFYRLKLRYELKPDLFDKDGNLITKPDTDKAA